MSIWLLLLSLIPAMLYSAAPQEISFPSADGGVVHAQLWGGGSHGVVLAHGAVFNKESWAPLASKMADRGLRALAIDFRGYGKSTAGSRGNDLSIDVLAAIRYLKAEGCETVSVIGGSMGGLAAARAAVETEPGEIDRLILLAAGGVGNPEKLPGKKLFIVSRGDAGHASVVEQHRRAPDPKKLVVLEGNAHAQHIFKTDKADELTKLILDWLLN